MPRLLQVSASFIRCSVKLHWEGKISTSRSPSLRYLSKNLRCSQTFKGMPSRKVTIRSTLMSQWMILCLISHRQKRLLSLLTSFPNSKGWIQHSNTSYLMQAMLHLRPRIPFSAVRWGVTCRPIHLSRAWVAWRWSIAKKGLTSRYLPRDDPRWWFRRIKWERSLKRWVRDLTYCLHHQLTRVRLRWWNRLTSHISRRHPKLGTCFPWNLHKGRWLARLSTSTQEAVRSSIMIPCFT